MPDTAGPEALLDQLVEAWLTAKTPEAFGDIAGEIAEQWRQKRHDTRIRHAGTIDTETGEWKE